VVACLLDGLNFPRFIYKRACIGTNVRAELNGLAKKLSFQIQVVYFKIRVFQVNFLREVHLISCGFGKQANNV